jgi:acyl-CoA thioesterase
MATDTLLSRALASARAGAYPMRIGLEPGDAEGGTARARLRRTPESKNRAGYIHGGAIASALLGAAELAAASSERDRHAAELRVTSTHISFLAPVGDVELDAVARVLRRGRDTVHVEAQVAAPATEPCAAALLVYRIVDADVPRSRGRAAPVSIDPSVARAGLPGSPYMTAAGAQLLGEHDGWSCMALPAAGNDAAGGRVHDGMVVGLVDTCCALAVLADNRGRIRGPSATVTLSMTWADVIAGDLTAGARLVGRVDALFTSEAQVWSTAGADVCASAVVCYRNTTIES